MPGQNRFNVGAGDPWNSQEAVRQLMTRFYELSQRLTHFSVTLQKISNIAMVVEQMFGRVSAGLMLMFGLPRVMRSDLYHSVVNKGRTNRGGFPTGGGGGDNSGGPGGGGGDYPKTREEWLNYYKMKAEARKQAEEESGIKYKRWDVDEAKKVSEQKLEIFEHEVVRKKAILEKYWRSQPKKTKEDWEDEVEAKKIADVKTQISEQEDIVAEKQKHLGKRDLAEQLKMQADYEQSIKDYHKLAELEPDPDIKEEFLNDALNLEKQLKVILHNIKAFSDLDQAIDKIKELKDVLQKLTDISSDEINKKIARFENIKAKALTDKDLAEKGQDYYVVHQQESIVQKSDAAIEELKKHPNYQPPVPFTNAPAPQNNQVDKDPLWWASGQNQLFYQNQGQVRKQIKTKLDDENYMLDVKRSNYRLVYQSMREKEKDSLSWIANSLIGNLTPDQEDHLKSIQKNRDILKKIEEEIANNISVIKDIEKAYSIANTQDLSPRTSMKDNWQSSPTSKGFFADLHEDKLGQFLSTLPKGSNYKRHLKEGTLNIFWKGFTENFKTIIEKFSESFNKQIIQTFSGSKIGKFLIPKIKTLAAVSIIGAGVISEFYSIISSKVKNVFATIFGKISWIIKDSLDFIGKSNLFKFAQIKVLGALRVFDPVIKKIGGFFGGPPKDKDPNLGNYSGDSGGINRIVEKFTGIITKVSTLFLGLAAAAQGLIKAASPDLFSTFTMSIQLLAAKVGTVLIPTFVNLSSWIQKTAFWFDSWESSSKNVLGSVLDWTLKITASIVVIGLLSKALSVLATTSGRFGLYLGITIGLLLKLNEKLEAERAKGKEVRETFKPLGREEALERLNKLAPTTMVSDLVVDRKDKVRILQEKIALNSNLKLFKEAQLHNLREESTSPAGLAEQALYNVTDGALGKDYFPAIRKLGLELKEYTDNIAILNQAKDAIVTRKPVELNVGMPLTRNEEVSKSQELLMHIQSQKVTPRYQGVEEAYKNIQVEALGKSPLEMILEKTVADNLREVISSLGKQLNQAEKTNQYLEQAVRP